MFKRLLEGFFFGFPFLLINREQWNNKIIYYPEEIFKNDWRNIGNDLKNIVRSKIKTKEENND